MRRVFRVLVRFVFVAILEALSLLVMDWLVPGISLTPPESVNVLIVAMSAALVLALMNSLLRPFLVMLTLPLNVLTYGLPTLFINASMLLLTTLILPYLQVRSFGAAIWGTLILATVNTFLMSLTTIDDDYSFFDGVVQWLSKRQQIDSAAESGRGLVMLEIDGIDEILHAVGHGDVKCLAGIDGDHAEGLGDLHPVEVHAQIVFLKGPDVTLVRWCAYVTELVQRRLELEPAPHEAGREAAGHAMPLQQQHLGALGRQLRGRAQASVPRADDCAVVSLLQPLWGPPLDHVLALRVGVAAGVALPAVET